MLIPTELPIFRAAVLSVTLALVACGGENTAVEQTVVEQAAIEQAAVEGPAGCGPLGDNLIQDPDFSTLFAHHSQRQWHTAEHAAGGTFEPNVDKGVLSISKVGDEPWFIVTQSPDETALAGKRLSFSAEIRLELHKPKHAHSFGYGGGLTVLAKRGGKIVLNSKMEHEPNFGTHDWQPVEVVFQLPKNVSYLRLGFLHQAGGSIHVRNPSLQEVGSACPVTIGKKPKQA